MQEKAQYRNLYKHNYLRNKSDTKKWIKVCCDLCHTNVYNWIKIIKIPSLLTKIFNLQLMNHLLLLIKVFSELLINLP